MASQTHSKMLTASREKGTESLIQRSRVTAQVGTPFSSPWKLMGLRLSCQADLRTMPQFHHGGTYL